MDAGRDGGPAVHASREAAAAPKPRDARQEPRNVIWKKMMALLFGLIFPLPFFLTGEAAWQGFRHAREQSIRSSSSRSDDLPLPLPAQRRSRISRRRFVPTGQKVHLPHDSCCVNQRKSRATSTMRKTPGCIVLDKNERKRKNLRSKSK